MPSPSPRNIINKSLGHIQALGLSDASRDLELLQRHAALTGHRIRPVPCTRIYAGKSCGNQTEPFPTSSTEWAQFGEPLAHDNMELPAAQAVSTAGTRAFLGLDTTQRVLYLLLMKD